MCMSPDAPLKKRILVAEDDKNIQLIMSDYLHACGFEVSLANDGAEALHAMSHQKPDLLIVDIAMPGLDGLEVARQVRQNPILADLPIMALTARAFPENEAQAYQAGCNVFVSKPF